MLVRRDARQSREDLLDLNLSLPFQSEVNTGFGVLAKVYLDALTHLNNGQRVRDPNVEGVKEAKAVALEICEETFAGVKGPKLEVERGFRFWDVVSRRFRLPPLGFRSHTRPLPFFLRFSLFAHCVFVPRRRSLPCGSCTRRARSCASWWISSRRRRHGLLPCVREWFLPVRNRLRRAPGCPGGRQRELGRTARQRFLGAEGTSDNTACVMLLLQCTRDYSVHFLL